jgi:hypothetical protein
VAATSSFDSIVAAVALVATVFGIYELSSICSSAVVTASIPHVTSYPTQIVIPVYLLLTTVVGAFILALAVRFLRHPIGTSISDGDKICEPAEESERYYDESEHYYDGGRPAVPRGKRLYCDPNSREGRGCISIRLSCASKLKPTASPRLLPVNCAPQLEAQVRPYVPLLTSIEAMLLNSTH